VGDGKCKASTLVVMKSAESSNVGILMRGVDHCKEVGDNLNTTQTPECTKEKYNAKIKVKGSLLRSHQQPT
jgi:hypothetical protein